MVHGFNIVHEVNIHELRESHCSFVNLQSEHQSLKKQLSTLASWFCEVQAAIIPRRLEVDPSQTNSEALIKALILIRTPESVKLTLKAIL